jgi:hypothetical protein
MRCWLPEKLLLDRKLNRGRSRKRKNRLRLDGGSGNQRDYANCCSIPKRRRMLPQGAPDEPPPVLVRLPSSSVRHLNSSAAHQEVLGNLAVSNSFTVRFGRIGTVDSRQTFSDEHKGKREPRTWCGKAEEGLRRTETDGSELAAMSCSP